MSEQIHRIWYIVKNYVLDETNIAIITASSAFMFLASILVIPWFISRLPDDYFMHHRPSLREEMHEHHLGKVLLKIAKNVLGWLLMLAGIAMLALPGQGLLTILVAIILIDFPRKKDLELRILNMKGVRESANWLRGKYGRGPFLVDAHPKAQDEPHH